MIYIYILGTRNRRSMRRCFIAVSYFDFDEGMCTAYMIEKWG